MEISIVDLVQKKQNDQLVTDGSESTFMNDVVEASKNQPVIVDFWAPWCGPCKSLGPALEAEINNHSGKVKMVKIDIDQNQSIAQQMRIQSIPAVFAFVDGQPVDGFQGAKTPSEIKDFVKKVISLGPNNNADEGLESALEMAEKMLEDGEFSDSLGVFLAIIDQDAKTTKAYAGVVKSYLGLSELNNAQEFIADLQTLIQQPSISAQNIGLEECANLVKNQMHKDNLPAELYEIPGGPPLVFGHLKSSKSKKE